MGYSLGIDLGTTFTAAAIDRIGHIEMATLGDRTAAIPSVVLMRGEGAVLTGDAANRRAMMEPDRVAREFKRRLGDPTPLVLGGAPHSVASVLAQLLSSVVGKVAEREGGAAEHVMLTHPANWGPYKRELFDSVPRIAEVDRVSMITEPEAAAAHYATSERLADGALIAVYDFGGGTFDATVLRRRAAGFEILGTPEGVEGLGGIDFDEAVFAFVDRTLDGAVTALDFTDRQNAGALIRLRQECVLAKETLSADTETVIPVLMPGLQTEVRLTRAELEEMMRPPIESTVSALRRALRSARVEPEALDAVLLVGGSSRIPLVSEMVSAALGRPTAVDAHPKHVIALGAAALAGEAHGRTGNGVEPPVPTTVLPAVTRQVAPRPRSEPRPEPARDRPNPAPARPAAPAPSSPAPSGAAPSGAVRSTHGPSGADASASGRQRLPADPPGATAATIAVPATAPRSAAPRPATEPVRPGSGTTGIGRPPAAPPLGDPGAAGRP
ncbi:Hsp70 family protein, partial [Pseudonocardia sp.]|uniref:Hsp70 family protein n=1 Tax=Pseudonocardia sp. TaxID=60912 RepID=UPI0026360DC0